jgi:hypothetical protein
MGERWEESEGSWSAKRAKAVRPQLRRPTVCWGPPYSAQPIISRPVFHPVFAPRTLKRVIQVHCTDTDKLPSS